MHNLYGLILGTIYIPAILCSCAALIGFFWWGFGGLFTYFLLGFFVGAFKNWNDWPSLPKIGVVLSPFLFITMAIFSYFPDFAWWALGILFVYTVLASLSAYSLWVRFPPRKPGSG